MPKRGKRMRVEKGGKGAKYCRLRVADPIGFDPESLRLKKIKKGVKVIVGCPKGKYDAYADRCTVGTRAQSILKKKLPSGACPTFDTPKDLVK